MAAGTLNDTEQQLKLKRGLRANLLTKAAVLLGIQAEPFYATDTKQLFIHDGTDLQPVATLDMAITHNGVIQTHNGRPVVHF